MKVSKVETDQIRQGHTSGRYENCNLSSRWIKTSVRVRKEHANLSEQERELGTDLVPGVLVVGEHRVVHDQLHTHTPHAVRNVFKSRKFRITQIVFRKFVIRTVINLRNCA